MAKKKETISLFKVVAENLSSNELGLKTKKESILLVDEKLPPQNHNCKKELTQILIDYKSLYDDLHNFRDELQRKIMNIEKRLYKLMEDH